MNYRRDNSYQIIPRRIRPVAYLPRRQQEVLNPILSQSGLDR
jgi:hypothetical protein